MNSTEATDEILCIEADDRPPVEEDSSTAFALALTRSRIEVDRVLDELPNIRQEARRVITRDLSFCPDPEQLRMIDSMAHGRAGKGPLRESLRSILALRLVATQAVDELLDATTLDPQRIRRAGELMPPLTTAVRYMEEGVRANVKELPPDDRDCLLQTAQALIPSRESLITGAVLAPRLELLALAGAQDELKAAMPQLTDDDIALVHDFLSSETESTGGASRVCINALTLRTIIEDDLVSWEMLHGVSEGNPEATGSREWSLARLERDKIAYDILAEQLQTRQDMALTAGLGEFADELSRVKGELFASYLKLTPALRDASRSTSTDAGVESTAQLDMESLLEQCALADNVAEGQKKVSTDEVYLNALRGMDGESAPPTPRVVREHNLQKEKRRLRVMIGIAVTLAVIVVIQYGVRLREEPPQEVLLDVTDFPGKVLLSDAMAVGPMMYAQVSHFTWDALTEKRRQRRVEDLALIASDRGFEKLWLTDENQRDLATWSKTDGVELVAGPLSRPGSD